MRDTANYYLHQFRPPPPPPALSASTVSIIRTAVACCAAAGCSSSQLAVARQRARRTRRRPPPPAAACAARASRRRGRRRGPRAPAAPAERVARRAGARAPPPPAISSPSPALGDALRRELLLLARDLLRLEQRLARRRLPGELVAGRVGEQVLGRAYDIQSAASSSRAIASRSRRARSFCATFEAGVALVASRSRSVRAQVDGERALGGGRVGGRARPRSRGSRDSSARSTPTTRATRERRRRARRARAGRPLHGRRR